MRTVWSGSVKQSSINSSAMKIFLLMKHVFFMSKCNVKWHSRMIVIAIEAGCCIVFHAKMLFIQLVLIALWTCGLYRNGCCILFLCDMFSCDHAALISSLGYHCESSREIYRILARREGFGWVEVGRQPASFLVAMCRGRAGLWGEEAMLQQDSWASR